MPRTSKRSAKTKSKAKRSYKKKATSNSSASMIKDNNARASSISTQTPLDSNTAYNFQFQLVNASTRILNVAKAYQEFKIDYVEVRLKPYYDTFATGATAGITAPQLYHQIIKDPSVSDMVDISQFRYNGINPMPFSKDGNKVWRYKPAASVVPVGAGSSASGMIKVSPWLDTEDFTSTATTPVFSTTQHYGSSLWIDTVEATKIPLANVEVEIHYVFRKPRSDYVNSGNAHSTPVRL